MTAPRDTRIFQEQVNRAMRGVIGHNFKEVDDTYSVQLTDVVLYCDSGSAGFTVTLPPALQMKYRFLYIAKKGGDANTVTIDGDGHTINGSSTYTLVEQFASAILFSDGIVWHVFVDSGSGSGISAYDIRNFGAVDGQDNTVAIQATLDAVPTGELISLGGITSLVSDSVVIPTNNIGIVGPGIIKATAATFNPIVFDGVIRKGRFAHFSIWGAATTNGTAQYGISCSATDYATEVTVQDVDFSGPDASTGLNNGINLSTNGIWTRWKILANNFNRLIGVVSGTGYGVLVPNSHGNIVALNHFVGAAGQGRHAVYFSAGSSYNIAQTNHITDFNEDACIIYALASQPACIYNHIEGTISIGGGSATVDSASISILGNCQHNQIKLATVSGYNGVGILVSDHGEGGLCQHNRVTGGEVSLCQLIGVRVMGAKSTRIRGIDVHDNSQDSLGTYPGIEITSSGSFGTEVADDTVIGSCTSYGAQQRSAIRIDTGSPTPTNTRIAPDCTWGAGNVATTEYNGLAVELLAPQEPANADTSGATLPQVETEVNEIKAVLRAHRLIAT